jgi:hypothetical protein
MLSLAARLSSQKEISNVNFVLFRLYIFHPDVPDIVICCLVDQSRWQCRLISTNSTESGNPLSVTVLESFLNASVKENLLTKPSL